MGWDLGFFVLAAIGLTAGCLIPNRYLPPLPNDKLLHFAGFGLLSALALRVAHDRLEAALWLFGLLFGGWLIECLQQLVPGRGFCWRDLGANALGIAFVALCAQLYTALI